MRHKGFSLAALLLITGLILAACGGGGTTQAPTAAAPAAAPTAAAAPTTAPEATAAPAATTAPEATAAGAATAAAEPTAAPEAGGGAAGDPKAAALKAAEGKQIGGTLNLLGVWAGSELESFQATIKPFEEATGVKVEYEATRDFNAVLTTRVNGGNPPDVAAPPSASQTAEWASEGKLVALDDVVDMAQMKSDYGQSWLDLGSYEGKLYGVFVWSSLKGSIWYNPKTYDGPKPPKTWDELQAWSDQKAASGQTPWCIGLESGAASGWPATDWLEDIVLRQSGPDKYDQWYQGKLAWTSPEIKSAWQTFGKIATDPKMVFGGPTTELTTNFGDAGKPLFTTPPGCYLHHQASFITDFFTKGTPGVKAGDDFQFFGFPDIDPQYAGSAEVVADEFSIYKDSPQARAFIRYLTTPEAQAIWVQRGGKLPTNKRVPADAYPDPLAKQAGETITSAKIVRFDASDLMPEAMNSAFWKATLDYVQNPDSLDSILADLDKVQQDAYKK
jgi:alpha-glucoside transport system substrate-binding protein